MNGTMMLYATNRWALDIKENEIMTEKTRKKEQNHSCERESERIKNGINIPLDKLKAKRAFEHMSHVHQFRRILSLAPVTDTHWISSTFTGL